MGTCKFSGCCSSCTLSPTPFVASLPYPSSFSFLQASLARGLLSAVAFICAAVTSAWGTSQALELPFFLLSLSTIQAS